MSKRIRTDEALRRLQYSDVTASFRKAIKQWSRATDQAMGLEVLPTAKRREIHEEIKWACRRLRDMDRAVELNLPGAVAYCAVELCDLFSRLNHFVDVLPERNRLVPFAQRGEKNKRGTSAGAAKGNAKRKSNAAALKAEIVKDYRELINKGYGSKSAVYQLTFKHHRSESHIRRLVSPPKKIRKSGVLR